jgi:hypothetical protein
MVTWENYEEYMMMSADGELNPAEAQALSAFLEANPELKSELSAYETARLTPDTSLVFSDKRSLLKEEPARRIIAFPQWQRYSAAAGIALIICLSFFKLWNTDNSNIPMAKNDTIKTMGTPTVQPTVQPQEAIASNAGANVVPVEGQPAKKVTPRPVRKNVNKLSVHTAPVLARANDNVERIEPVPMKEIPQTNVAAAAVYAATSIPAIAVEKAAEPQSLLDKLHIEETKKAGMEDMAVAISQTYKKVNGLKDFDPRHITVRIEKNQLKLTF